jgi:mannose-1-phosphate guanylyltransferase/phosphomannomutase
MATLTLCRVTNPLEYGVVVTDESGRIRQFQEKPSWSEVVTDTINTGIYVLEPAIFKYYERNQVFDFSKDLFPILLKEDQPMYGYVSDGYWTDVGSIEEYVRATRDVLAGKVEVEWTGDHVDGVWREEGVEIALDAQVHGPVYLGKDVKVMSGAVIHGPTVIRDNTVVERRAHVDRSIVWRNAHIGPYSEIRGCILGTECNIQANAVIFENAVVADQSVIGRGAIIQPNVKIWPHKEVEAGAVVSTSIIWGSAGRRVLFGRYGVSGLINVDFTPEVMAKLGAAYGSILPVGSTITLNRDMAIPSRMLKWALASGFPSAGVNVLDLSAVPVPVARFYTGDSDAVGGAHVRVSPYDRTVADITFLDHNGLDLDKGMQRKVESAYFREDSRRAHLNDIGVTDYAPEVAERYTHAFMQAVDQEKVSQAGYRLVVDYSLGSTSDILPPILRSLGCDVIDLNSGRDMVHVPRSGSEYDTAFVQLGIIVSALGYDLGAMLDVHGEQLYVVDGTGQGVPRMQILAALACLVFQQREGTTVAVPVDAPAAFEELAGQYNGNVIRTRADAQSVMEAAAQEGIALAGDGRGRMIFPSLHPAFDGMFSLVKLLERLSGSRTKLHDLVASLPAWHIQNGEVACPWDKKGRVMRLLGEQYQNRRTSAADGIKIQLGEDWVLILPDPDEPQFHLVSESRSDAEARSLVDKYASIVTGLQQ